jgi:hypothetical protein
MKLHNLPAEYQLPLLRVPGGALIPSKALQRTPPINQSITMFLMTRINYGASLNDQICAKARDMRGSYACKVQACVYLLLCFNMNTISAGPKYHSKISPVILLSSKFISLSEKHFPQLCALGANL